MSKRSNACEFSPKVRERIKERDNNSCIFCMYGYRMDADCGYGGQIMHFVPRSHGGLGIEQNGAVGCLKHHQMLDNGLYHEEMIEIFREYLKGYYPDWNEESLIYDKHGTNRIDRR